MDTEWKCHCQRVKIRFSGEPFMCNNCHCTFCYPLAKYIDEKGGGVSAVVEKTGVAKAMYSLDKIKMIEGVELLTPLKIGEDGFNVRAYTSCCNTLCICDGGEKLEFSFRPFNRNDLYYSNGLKYEPVECVWNTQGGDNPEFVNIPEPKHNDLPDILMNVLQPELVAKTYGAYESSSIPGLYINPENVEEFV